jgi:hypothetical protein
VTGDWRRDIQEPTALGDGSIHPLLHAGQVAAKVERVTDIAGTNRSHGHSSVTPAPRAPCDRMLYRDTKPDL